MGTKKMPREKLRFAAGFVKNYPYLVLLAALYFKKKEALEIMNTFGTVVFPPEG